MRSVVRASITLLLALFALIAAAPAASAQAEEEPDNIVVLTGRAEVRAGETVDNVIIFDGPVVVDGTVNDALVAFNGDVLVRGTAREDVVAADGRVTVADGGRIEGDVVSRHRPVVEGDGRLDGSWERWNARAWSRATSVVGWGILRVVALVPVLGWLVSLAAVVVGLGAIAVAGRRARRRDVATEESGEPVRTPPAPPPPAPTPT